MAMLNKLDGTGTGPGNDRCRRLFNAIHEGFAILEPITDGNGRTVDLRILQINPAMEQMLGFVEASSRSVLELLPDLDPAFISGIADVIQTGSEDYSEFWSTRFQRWFDVRLNHIAEEPGDKIVLILNDITGRKNAEIDQTRNELLLRTIIQSASDFLFIKDRNSRVVFVNEAYGKAFGVDIASVIGKDDYELYGDPEVAARIIANDRRVMATGEGETFEETVNSPDGPMYFQFHKTPWRNEQGEIIGIVGSGMVITERKQLEDSLRRQAEALATADRNKNHFLSMLSHELRNPLAAIVMSLDLLNHVVGTDERAGRAIRVLQRQTSHLTHLVDDLLDVTRITANKIKLRTEPVELVSLVQRVLAEYQTQFDDKGIELHVETVEQPIDLAADPVRLTQAVSNLVHNALKYSSGGDSVTVRVDCDLEGETASVQVKDTGIGIDQELLPHLFEPFSQADRSLARSQGGLGLGLSIVKGMVELHGGQVTVWSEGSGKGSTFTICLPLRQRPADAAAASVEGPQ